MITNNFTRRQFGPSLEETQEMLKVIGVSDLNELVSKTIPGGILRNDPEMGIGKGMNEYEVMMDMKRLASKNKLYRNFIGTGYYETILPAPILRNILENPGWYTSYTPYQAEISQGRLEALLNFQTMVSDLTALPVANASLLDEATAAAEAMILAHNQRKREKVKNNANTFLVVGNVFPQTIDVLMTRSMPLGIEVKFSSLDELTITDDVFGILLQYPDQFGEVIDYSAVVEAAHQKDVLVIAVADLFSLTLIVPPGEWGADVAVGTTQRFGIPMGFGGPHAAYMATRQDFIRNMPGRIIGISKDARGERALRMTLQTREQHIKRERATSNICTAQALLAIMAGMYAVYHGPKGLKEIARHGNILSGVLAVEAEKYGYKQLNKNFVDTLLFELPVGVSQEQICKAALAAQMNFRYVENDKVGIHVGETVTLSEINTILSIFAVQAGKSFTAFVCKPEECVKISTFEEAFIRKSDYLKHAVFNSYQNETDLMRYVTKLANKDLALDRTMIPLGSCTMKLNAAVELFHLSWPEFANIHPFVPKDQAEGYLELLSGLEDMLAKVTGFDSVTLQPNSGAAGEYTGLMVIRAYHIAKGDAQRNVCLIPSSAHGTNPASAAMAGMKIVVVKCDANGNVDVEDLKAKASEHSADLSALMITYPSTHGIFEEEIRDIINTIHQHGGLVYMDGANMNAQVGLTSPGLIGADVCHLNLHKTFAIPHGGGGPGVGPIAVAKHLTEFLPKHSMVETGGKNGITAVAAAPYGSAFVAPISYVYLKLMGDEGLAMATKMAMLNANYMMKKLSVNYPILYKGKNGFVAHEFIIDCNPFHRIGITETDIAKRLMDYGFHAPTVAFPVHGTLMVEPTESEPLKELDRFIDAMNSIADEMKQVESGSMDKENNPLKNAPHTLDQITVEEWTRPYSRRVAMVTSTDKYWPTVARIDDAYGDRNVVCACEPIENYK